MLHASVVTELRRLPRAEFNESLQQPTGPAMAPYRCRRHPHVAVACLTSEGGLPLRLKEGETTAPRVEARRGACKKQNTHCGLLLYSS